MNVPPGAEVVYAEAQERQARLTRSFFEGLQKPAGPATVRALAREGSAKPYAELLECLFIFYCRSGARAVEGSPVPR